MWGRSTCESAGHKEKSSATVHDGGLLRSVCERCGKPIALRIGGWKGLPPTKAEAALPLITEDRRKGPRGTIFDRSARS